MTDRHKTLTIALYTAIGIFTFGYAARQEEKWNTAEYATCMTGPKHELCFNPRDGGFVGLISAPLWPLYWAWELQP